MTKDEALRLAWGALEDIGDEWGFTSQRTVPKRKEAITAIKEALAQRTWVGLTDEELSQIEGTHIGRSFAKAIEAKLKEKNT